jgi:hypothetical protein
MFVNPSPATGSVRPVRIATPTRTSETATIARSCRAHHRLHSRRTGMADIRVDDIDIHIPGHADTS